MSEKGSPPLRAAGGGLSLAQGSGQLHAHFATDGAGRQEPARGRVEAGVWHKSVRASVHMLRTPAAWACDANDLAAAEASGVRFLHLHDLESLEHRWAALSTIRSRGFTFDRGHGQQIALPLAWWRSTRVEAKALSEELRGPAPTVRQLALFGRAP